jgi:signal transduction histidine kinase
MFSQPALEPKEILPISELIGKVLRKVESKLPYYIRIEQDVQPGQMIRCHVQQITLVCVQVISNAIDALESKHDKKREIIGISTSEEGSGKEIFSRISIANSGPPIPEEEIKQIFDPFFSSRQDSSKKGMGMSLSYMIVKEHGGRIEIHNDDGGMVRFDILIPLSD